MGSPSPSTDLDGSSLDATFGALKNAVRREILDLLLEAHNDGLPGLHIGAVAAHLGLDRFSASRHLTVLVDAELVRVRRDSASRVHSIFVPGLIECETWLMPYSVALDQVDVADRQDTMPEHF